MAAALATSAIGLTVERILERLHAVSVVVPETDEGWLQVLPPAVPPVATVQEDDEYLPFPVTLSLDTTAPLPVRIQVPTIDPAPGPLGYNTAPMSFSDVSANSPLVVAGMTLAKPVSHNYLLAAPQIVVSTTGSDVTTYQADGSVTSTTGGMFPANWPADSHAI